MSSPFSLFSRYRNNGKRYVLRAELKAECCGHGPAGRSELEISEDPLGTNKGNHSPCATKQ